MQHFSFPQGHPVQYLLMLLKNKEAHISQGVFTLDGYACHYFSCSKIHLKHTPFLGIFFYRKAIIFFLGKAIQGESKRNRILVINI